MAVKPIQVLLVEDNPGDARLVVELLRDIESPKFQVTHIEQLNELERILDKTRFDVILLDLMLPDSSRLGTLMEIHGSALRVPVVVLTGMEDDVVGFWAMSEGADNYLVKGQVDGPGIAQAIQDAIAVHSGDQPHLRVVK